MYSFIRKGVLAVLLTLAVCAAAHAADPAKKYTGKKVLFLNSYHKGYEWSDAIHKGILSVLGSSGAELRVHYMDTKNNQGEDFKIKAGLDAKAVIDEWKPDVVIASDDNAVHYVVVPFLKNTATPVVFTGVNWDAEQYGLPCSNVTGMIEMDSVDQMLSLLKGLKPGSSRIAVLTPDTETEHQQLKNHRKSLGVDYTEERYVSTFDDWKKAYLELQDKYDVLLLQNNAGIKDWNNDEAKSFVLANAKIPTGSIDAPYMSPFIMVLYAKIPEELGAWPAERALEILDGKKPSDIPVGRNVKGQIYVNAPLVRKLGLTIPPEVLSVATISK